MVMYYDLPILNFLCEYKMFFTILKKLLSFTPFGAITNGADAIGGIIKMLPLIIALGVGGYFMYKFMSSENDKNKQTIIDQKGVIKQKDTANKDLKTTVDNNNASSASTINTLGEVYKGEKSIDQKAKDREVKKQKAIDEVNKGINLKPSSGLSSDTTQAQVDTPETIKVKEAKISEIQIDSLWSTFCDAQPDNQQCKVQS